LPNGLIIMANRASPAMRVDSCVTPLTTVGSRCTGLESAEVAYDAD